MTIEELEKAEQAAWGAFKAVRDQYQPLIDAAQNDWHKLHVEHMKEKQRAILRAEIEAENAK